MSAALNISTQGVGSRSGDVTGAISEICADRATVADVNSAGGPLIPDSSPKAHLGAEARTDTATRAQSDTGTTPATRAEADTDTATATRAKSDTGTAPATRAENLPANSTGIHTGTTTRAQSVPEVRTGSWVGGGNGTGTHDDARYVIASGLSPLAKQLPATFGNLDFHGAASTVNPTSENRLATPGNPGNTQTLGLGQSSLSPSDSDEFSQAGTTPDAPTSRVPVTASDVGGVEWAVPGVTGLTREKASTALPIMVAEILTSLGESLEQLAAQAAGFDPLTSRLVVEQFAVFLRRSEALYVQIVGRADQPGEWPTDSDFRSATAWLAATQLSTSGAARGKFADDQWLRSNKMFADSFARGEISGAHVSVMRRCITGKPWRQQTFAEFEKYFVDVSRRVNPRLLDRLVRAWAERVDDLVMGDSAQTTANAFAVQHEARVARWWQVGDLWEFQACLPAVDGALLAGVLNQIVEEDRRRTCTCRRASCRCSTDGRSLSQRRADAVMSMAQLLRAAARPASSPGGRTSPLPIPARKRPESGSGHGQPLSVADPHTRPDPLIRPAQPQDFGAASGGCANRAPKQTRGQRPEEVQRVGPDSAQRSTSSLEQQPGKVTGGEPDHGPSSDSMSQKAAEISAPDQKHRSSSSNENVPATQMRDARTGKPTVVPGQAGQSQSTHMPDQTNPPSRTTLAEQTALSKHNGVLGRGGRSGVTGGAALNVPELEGRDSFDAGGTVSSGCTHGTGSTHDPGSTDGNDVADTAGYLYADGTPFDHESDHSGATQQFAAGYESTGYESTGYESIGSESGAQGSDIVTRVDLLAEPSLANLDRTKVLLHIRLEDLIGSSGYPGGLAPTDVTIPATSSDNALPADDIPECDHADDPAMPGAIVPRTHSGSGLDQLHRDWNVTGLAPNEIAVHARGLGSQWLTGNGAGSGFLPRSTALAELCDTVVQRIITGPDSRPLDIGRKTRIVPADIRAALISRDRGCIIGVCDIPPAWCHAHHIQHWAHGGSTSLQNLALLCDAHHAQLHAGRWCITMGTNGRPVVTRTLSTDLSKRRQH